MKYIPVLSRLWWRLALVLMSEANNIVSLYYQQSELW